MNKLVIPLFALLLAAGCAKGPSGGLSPSGHFQLHLDQVANPANPEAKLNAVVISSTEGQVVFRDTDTSYSTYYDLSWAWDQDDRLWAYYEADKSVYIFQLEGDGWHKRRWGKERETFTYKDLVPPESIYGTPSRASLPPVPAA